MKNLIVVLLLVLSSKSASAQVTCESEEWFDEDFTGYCFTNYASGKLHYKIHFVKGEKTGLYEEFYEDGDTSAVANYEDWDLVGHCVRYFKNGNIRIEMNIESSGDGTISVYYSDGSIKKTGTFERYARVGSWSYYSKDGVVQELKTFNEVEEHRKAQEKLDKEHAGEDIQYIQEWPNSVADEFFVDMEEPYY